MMSFMASLLAQPDSLNSLLCMHNRAFNVSVVPFAAVAGLMVEPDAAAAQLLNGQAFCFLPITTTNLPVHVNGIVHLLLTIGIISATQVCLQTHALLIC